MYSDSAAQQSTTNSTNASGVPGIHVLGTRVDQTSYEHATSQILGWARRGRSCFVCAANVHMIMEAYDDPEFRRAVNSAALRTPDGMPLVWMLRRLGAPAQQRTYGPTLMLHLCAAAAVAGLPIGLYGGRPDVLEALKRRLRKDYPDLKIAYAYSPPFRPLSEEEEAQVAAQIDAAGASILFVGLGCPKQERWMARHVSRVTAVMVGVGAAFDFHAGAVRQAPDWMQRAGLEWLFRLCCEPRRLVWRYLRHNPRFVVLAIRQLLSQQRPPKRAAAIGDVGRWG